MLVAFTDALFTPGAIRAIFISGGEPTFATTRIIPMHLNKGKTIRQCLTDWLDYGKNPEKTENDIPVPQIKTPQSTSPETTALPTFCPYSA